MVASPGVVATMAVEPSIPDLGEKVSPTEAPIVMNFSSVAELKKQIAADGDLLSAHAMSWMQLKTVFGFMFSIVVGANLILIVWCVPSSRAKLQAIAIGGPLGDPTKLSVVAGVVVGFMILAFGLAHMRLASMSWAIGELGGKMLDDYAAQVASAMMTTSVTLTNDSLTVKPWNVVARNSVGWEIAINEFNSSIYVQNKKMLVAAIANHMKCEIGKECALALDVMVSPGTDPSAQLGPTLKSGLGGGGMATISFDADFKGRLGNSEHTAFLPVNLPLKMDVFPGLHLNSAGMANVQKVQEVITKGLQQIHMADLTAMEYKRFTITGPLSSNTKAIIIILWLCVLLLSACLMLALMFACAQKTEESARELLARTAETRHQRLQAHRRCQRPRQHPWPRLRRHRHQQPLLRRRRQQHQGLTMTPTTNSSPFAVA